MKTYINYEGKQWIKKYDMILMNKKNNRKNGFWPFGLKFYISRIECHNNVKFDLYI